MKLVSGLYVPGNSAKMLRKAVGTAASVICPDLEDSVPHSQKEEARKTVKSLLPELRQSFSGLIFPRINGPESPLFEADLSEFKTPTHFDGLCVPMVNSVQDLRKLPTNIPLII